MLQGKELTDLLEVLELLKLANCASDQDQRALRLRRLAEHEALPLIEDLIAEAIVAAQLSRPQEPESLPEEIRRLRQALWQPS